MNIGTLFSRHARYRPHHLAFVFEDQRLTWSELNRSINRLANALTALGRSDEELDGMVSRRRRRSPKQPPQQSGSPRQGLSYRIFTASSGEEAVEIVEQELEAGRPQ